MINETPLMKQYKEIKAQNMDNILFYRLGDFYEMFFEDAVTASKELGLTLTKRNKEKGVDVPLAGIPYHAAGSYIAKLINKGYKVAICEQTEDPRFANGIVKREVIRIITPGTVIDSEYLDDKNNSYLMGIKIEDNICAIAYVDITTGEFKTSEFYGKDVMFRLLGEINKIKPKEILMEERAYDNYYSILKGHLSIENISISKQSEIKNSEKYLKEYFNIISLESYGLLSKNDAINISAIVINYISELQKGKEFPISKISYVNSENIMELNLNTQKNLEIFENYREKNNIGTLVWILDQCMTSMGSRLLKVFIKNPILNLNEIKKRQKDVSFFVDNVLIREETRNKLKNIYDIERIIGKLVLGNENGKDLIALKSSIKNAIETVNLINNSEIFMINIEKLEYIQNSIEKAIVEDPPFSIREGNFIKKEYSQELDELHNIAKNGMDYLLQMETRERERTGIRGLRIKYNKISGYFIEITKSYEKLIPSDYIRRQTLANAERYTMQELKELEHKILYANEKIQDLEYQIFKQLTNEIKEYKNILQELAYKIAYLDVISDFAHIAIKNSYIKPDLNDRNDLEIIGGRHPVVEKLISIGEYIKNNVDFNENKKMIILTGPNMSGKSTYMKQIALIIIMSHMGSYIPADYANIPIVDKIFTRIGASDDLLTGQSTFMLEMSEVANIVNSATERSFIILDEIGRGTSTFDGISLATAITEYIHEKIKAKTIFATHYHELTQLEEKLEKAANYRIEVKESDNEIIFLREIVKGGADKSYGIEVARLAGLPKEILNRSREILEKLEDRKELMESNIDRKQMLLFSNEESLLIKNELIDIEKEKKEKQQILEKERIIQEKMIISALRNIETDSLTPIEALIKLNEIKKILK
ncbi:MAG: DNA mismatch repair protein MutS [Fusobacteriaceae bacterium]|jgi:DNA mismatch repair protein MutS|nr:DNA mismatch repair protein MutS [Fusobacteriaceae bacterium]